jgi:hypothetical protein
VVAFALSGQHTRTAAAELIMFEAAGCPWCQRWHAEVGKAYVHSPEGRRAPLRRVQLGTPLGDVALSRPVHATPTFVLAHDGRELGRITGYPGADFFWGMLAELMRQMPAATN